MIVSKSFYQFKNLKITLIKSEQNIDLDLLIEKFGELTVLVTHINNGMFNIEGRGELQEIFDYEIIRNLNWEQINLNF